MPLLWSYGVTTVLERKEDLLPRTLESLVKGGFSKPRLFVDGERPAAALSYEMQWKLEVTPRWPKVRALGNWILALWELYLRVPNADRYAIFQDDMVCCKGLREYLEKSPYPPKGYLNLLTMHYNEGVIKDKPMGWYEAGVINTKDPLKHQTGLGAVALVFSRLAVTTLLSSPEFVNKCQDASRRGHQNIDGGIVNAMNKRGWREYVHSPSLVQHTGANSSTLGNPAFPLAQTFPGEEHSLVLEQKG